VLKKSADEFFSSKGREPDAISRRLLVLESDSALFKLQDSVVADGDSKDVRREILECGFPRSNWFQVDYPLLLPYAFVDSRKEAGLLQLISNLRAEDDVERFAWNEKRRRRPEPGWKLKNRGRILPYVAKNSLRP
jgi:hypothetical protein